MSETLLLTEQLIRCQSITPHDGNCQELISARLRRLDFHIEPMKFEEVDNLWARHGTHYPLVVFAGHTDVVPTGPIEAWSSPPFEPSTRDGMLYGRGAADMKSGLAAMVVAAENFINKHPHYDGSIAFLITSDEEGVNTHGTKKVIETLVNRHEKIDYCVIGEPSSNLQLGDQIRVGRRGSLHGKLTIKGKQGHVAYPEKAENAIHSALPALLELSNTVWDEGNAFFPKTTFQISQLHAGTGAANVIPGLADITFNFRFGTASTVESLQSKVLQILKKHSLQFDLTWDISGLPFLTKQGKLIEAAKTAIMEVTQQQTLLSTGGGTSDGRFIAPTGAEVIELGPCNASIHQINEHVCIAELDPLTVIYEKILESLLLSQNKTS